LYLYASGGDLATQIAAALASLGGTLSAPVDRATIHLDGLAYTSGPITLPNSTTAPYVRYVDLGCSGSKITPTSSTAPLLHVLAQNNNGGAAHGAVHGCDFVTPASAPAIQQDSRQALDIYNNIFEGGQYQVELNNTLFEDGSQGYNEQHRIHDNDFVTPSIAGVWIALNGGTDSAEYGDIDHSNHFQLACGAAAIQVDAGITIQGGELSGKINTSQSGCLSSNPVLAIRMNGAAYRGTRGNWTGEDTAGAGYFYLVGGTGEMTIIDSGIIATGMNLKLNASSFSHTTLPYGVYTTLFGSQSAAKVDDESHGFGFVLARKTIFEIGQQMLRVWLGGENGQGDFSVYNRGMAATPETATSESSVLRATTSGVGVGPGYSQIGADSACHDTAGCNTSPDILAAQSFTVAIPGDGRTFRSHAESDGIHVTYVNGTTAGGQPTVPILFDGYDSSGSAPYIVKTLVKFY
jgi:hypothetical protein